MLGAAKAKRFSRREFVRSATLVAGVVAALPVLSACAPSGPAAPKAEAPKPAAPTEAAKAAPAAAPTAAPAATAPSRGGELKIGLYRTFENLDPAVYWGPPETMVTQMVFDSLVYLGNDLKFHPGLAESWEVSEGGKVLTFKLRRGVKFHDGTDLKADAAKFHFDRCVDPATKSKYARSLLGPYDSTVVMDDYTVQLRLKSAYAPILDSLSQGYLGIPSPTAVKKFGDQFEDNLVGSGPFKFVEWKRDSQLILERNRDYAWGVTFPDKTNPGLSHVDRLIFKFIPEVGTRDALMDGRKEINVEAWPGTQSLPRWRKDTNYKVYDGVSPGTTWLNFINVEKPPTSELAVRQAINFAVDKDTIVKKFFEGVSLPTWNLLGTTTFGYDKTLDSIYSYDPARARDLLEKAGWKVGADGARTKEGQPLQLDVFTSSGEKEAYKELMAAQLQDAGFSVKLITGTGAERAVAGSKGLYHLINRQFEASDPHFLVDLFHSQGIGTFAWSMARDADLDKMLEEQDATLELDRRKATIVRATKHILEQAYVVPIYLSLFTWVTTADVQDFHMDARSWYPYFQDASLKQ